MWLSWVEPGHLAMSTMTNTFEIVSIFDRENGIVCHRSLRWQLSESFVSRFSHMDVDRNVSTAILNKCRETTSAIFSFRTHEQNGRQSVRTDAAVPTERTLLVGERKKKPFERVLKPFERTSELFERMSQYFELMLIYFERICKPFERFVERFERIFFGRSNGWRTDN